MATLKDDEIRWILSIDAKGVQGELRQITSETIKLEQENKSLNNGLKITEQSLNAAEKEMKRLAAAGKENSRAFANAEQNYYDAAREIDELKQQIEANTKAIDENNKKHENIIETMRIEDMTMSQLKNRANELQKQLDHTSLSLDPEAYIELQKELDNVNEGMNIIKISSQKLSQQMELEDMTMSQLKNSANQLQNQLDNTSLSADPESYKALQQELDNVNERINVVIISSQKLSQQMELEDMTMAQLKNRANELQKQLDHTSLSADPKAYKALQKELDGVNKRADVVKSSQQNLLQRFAGMNHPIGTAAKAIQGFGQALKALAMNPVGIIIMAIVVALSALKTAIAGSSSASTKFAGIMNVLNVIFDTYKRLITECVKMLWNLITLDFSAVKKNINNMIDMTASLKDNAIAAYEAAAAQTALKNAMARNADIEQVNKARIEELRQVTQDTTKSVKERMEASKELMDLEKQNYKMSLSNVVGLYNAFKNEGKGANNIRLLNGSVKYNAPEMESSTDGVDKNVKPDCPIMFYFFYGDITVGYANTMRELYLGVTDNIEYSSEKKLHFSLSFDSSDGIYNTFYKNFDEIIQRSFIPVSWKNMNIPAQMLSDFNMCQPVLIDGQLLWAESLKYEITNNDVKVIEFKARTLKK